MTVRRFFDAAGNASDLQSASVDVDSTPPSAVAPAVAAFVTSTLPLLMPDAGETEVSVSGSRTAPVGFVTANPGDVVNVTLTDIDGAKSLDVRTATSPTTPRHSPRRSPRRP